MERHRLPACVHSWMGALESASPQCRVTPVWPVCYPECPHCSEQGQNHLVRTGVIMQGCPASPGKASAAELRKHKLSFCQTECPFGWSVTSLEPGVKEARCPPPGVSLWSGGALRGTPAPHASVSVLLGAVQSRSRSEGFVLFQESILAFFFSNPAPPPKKMKYKIALQMQTQMVFALVFYL